MAVLWVKLFAKHTEMSFLNLFLVGGTVTSKGNDFSYPLICWFSSITILWCNVLFAASFWLRHINIFFVSSFEHLMSTKSSTISFDQCKLFCNRSNLSLLRWSAFCLMSSSWSKRNYCENVLCMAKKIISF